MVARPLAYVALPETRAKGLCKKLSKEVDKQ